jgi:endonuclease YncB( thermonuclease family)
LWNSVYEPNTESNLYHDCVSADPVTVYSRYGRISGVVLVNGKNANLKMVKAGLAEVYRGKHAMYFNPKTYDAEGR